MEVKWHDLSDKLLDIIFGFVGEYEWKSNHLMIVAKNWWKKRDGRILYHPVQWLDLADELWDKILGFVGEYDWKSNNLMIVAKNWWKRHDRPDKVGTIVLESMQTPRIVYVPEFGKNICSCLESCKSFI